MMMKEKPAMEAPRNDPWSWRPDDAAWFRMIGERSAAWQPAGSLRLETDAVHGAIADAARERAGWLNHPSLNPLLLPLGERPASDLQLAARAAARSGRELGVVELAEDLWLWTPSGGRAIEAGRYELAELGREIAADEHPFPIHLDVWSDSIGGPFPVDFFHPDEWSWGSRRDAGEQDRTKLRGEIRRYAEAVSVLLQLLPGPADWTLAMTSVIIPLYNATPEKFRSGSHGELPGAVYIDLGSGVHRILETLIHETAHQYLRVAEAAGALIEPGHDGRYSSPLRPEPRPLRGILLAYHALAYMCALYGDLFRVGIGDGCAADYRTLRGKMDDAERTLLDNRMHLTDAGAHFLDETIKVADYGRD